MAMKMEMSPLSSDVHKVLVREQQAELKGREFRSFSSFSMCAFFNGMQQMKCVAQRWSHEPWTQWVEVLI